jgi:hypothetical protein
MEGIDKKNNSDSNLDPKEDLEITKKFLIEVSGESETSSSVELSNYEEALDLFNQSSKEGKNTILYEIHKSKIDGSVVKKIPVLNSSKHAERMRAPQEESKEANPSSDATVNAPVSTPSSPDKKENLTLLMKNKIIALAYVVAGYLKRVLPGEPDDNAPVSTPSSPDKKEKMTIKTMKNKIIVLASVIAGLIILLFILDILAAGASGNMSGHLIAFDAIQNYDVKSTANVDST